MAPLEECGRLGELQSRHHNGSQAVGAVVDEELAARQRVAVAEYRATTALLATAEALLHTHRCADADPPTQSAGKPSQLWN